MDRMVKYRNIWIVLSLAIAHHVVAILSGFDDLREGLRAIVTLLATGAALYLVRETEP